MPKNHKAKNLIKQKAKLKVLIVKAVDKLPPAPTGTQNDPEIDKIDKTLSEIL